jgi:hypothetical protein
VVRSARPDAPSGYLMGQAVFTEAGPGRYLYVEAGTLHLPDGPVPVQRRYVYALEAATGDVLVSHAGVDRDGLIHRLSLRPTADPAGPWRASHTHRCGADSYAVAYSFWVRPPARGSIAIRYRVDGPHKAYTLTSVLGRGRAVLRADQLLRPVAPVC